MATTSTTFDTTTLTFVLRNLAPYTGIKLDGPNYLAWFFLVVPILKSHDFMGIVDGTKPCPSQFLPDDQGKEVLNPTYSLWNKKDQFILNWLNMTLIESVLSTLYGLHTSQQVWKFLATRFAS